MIARIQRKEYQGFVLIAAAICLIFIFGVLGLTFDLGRLYITRNELQAFCDAAVVAANQELNGTDAGLNRARAVVADYPNMWNFSTQTVVSPSITFGTNAAGPFVANPPSPPTDYRFAHVEAQGNVAMYFMPVLSAFSSTPAAVLLTGIGSTSLTARSDAGQTRVDSFSENLLPYSPDAHLDPGRTPVYNPPAAQPDLFNFVIGKKYTMRWPPKGQREKAGFWCQGDQEHDFTTPDGSAERGFIDIGKISGSGGSAYIRQAIISNVQAHPLEVGEPIVNVTGNRGTESDALRERVNQDTDNYSATFAAYMANVDANGKRIGNGRRVVYMPVNNPYNGDRIVEFATFFLPLDSDVCGNGNTSPCCAEYIGTGLLFGKPGASTTPAVYHTMILR